MRSRELVYVEAPAETPNPFGVPLQELPMRLADPRPVTDHETRALVTVEMMHRLGGRATEALLRGEPGLAALLLSQARAVAQERMTASVASQALADHIRQTAQARLEAIHRAQAIPEPPRASA